MISNKWRVLKHAAKLYDMCALIAAFLFATFVLRSTPTGMSLSGFMTVRVKLVNCLLFALLLAAWHNLFVLCGLYVSKRLTRRVTEIYGVSKATVLASAFLLLVAKTMHIKMVSFSFVLMFWIVCTWAMASGRLVARSLLVALRSRGRNSRFVLIVGTNERAFGFAESIRARPELGYHIVGFVDDDWAGIPKFEASGNTRCCNFSGLANFLRHNVVDEAAIYLPLRSYYEHAVQLIAVCEHHGIVIRVDSQVFNLRSQDSSAVRLDENSQVVAVASSPRSGPALLKRLIDCLVSAVALMVLSPLLLIVALLVKFTSDGPVFFRQTRVGLNKRMFSIYKFRTMIADAEKVQDQLLSMNEMTGPVFKIKQDPRITPLGRILRNTSIDELPQLFNVLKGEMSLVGPRAMSLRDYELFDNDGHRRRFSVKPGVTCLWQVKGRNSIPFEQWMELDLLYIDQWSLWLDLKILAQTVPAVLRGTGAA
jgi:exopolysaccharide biosynthesis polyprenyl glycosylphosphotransferase